MYLTYSFLIHILQMLKKLTLVNSKLEESCGIKEYMYGFCKFSAKLPSQKIMCQYALLPTALKPISCLVQIEPLPSVK